MNSIFQWKHWYRYKIYDFIECYGLQEISWFWNFTWWNAFISLLLLPVFLSSMWRKLHLESTWKERFPFSPIFVQPGIHNCFHLLVVLLWTWQVPATSQDHQREDLPASQGWGATPAKHIQDTYFAVAFFGLKKKKLLVWSVKTSINTKFKGSLLVHFITRKNVQRT